ncbi:hypothetical protein [Streptomyces bottropensis]|uniref:hypothetical protein n=1 Tax=Streptomyces bottropensis TaxID=42235 RepID=UPI0036874AA6
MIHGVQDGEGFRIAPDAPLWFMNRLECERFEEDHFFHNPYGYWRLTPGWTRAPNAGGVMDRGGTGRERRRRAAEARKSPGHEPNPAPLSGVSVPIAVPPSRATAPGTKDRRDT